ncbi:baculoviral IAP repeat-containing protein 3-like isoform X1 [Haliotis cracherodii]|uniref:baculoviral IAP repeat-containing protein 3-like isoform X1 n=1 Tax=Haliotis cracherodii TaxID=6455 RepID=UPI0039E8F35D
MAPQNEVGAPQLSRKADSGSICVGSADRVTDNPGVIRQSLITTDHTVQSYETPLQSKEQYSDTDHMPTKECGKRFLVSLVNTLSHHGSALSSLEQDLTSATVEQRSHGEAQPYPENLKVKVYKQRKGEQKFKNTFSAAVSPQTLRKLRSCERKDQHDLSNVSMGKQSKVSSNYCIAHNRDLKSSMKPSVHATKQNKILETTDITYSKETFNIDSDKHRVDEEEQVAQPQRTKEKKKKLFDAVHSAVHDVRYDTDEVDRSSADKKYKEIIDDLKYAVFHGMLERSHVTSPFVSLHDYFAKKAKNEALTNEEQMRYEGLRLKSFAQVDMSVSYLRLAAAGFYATSNGDETRCFSCGVTNRNWQTKDNPHILHAMISPNCIYVTGTDERNVPIQVPAVSDTGHEPQFRNGSNPETRVSESASNGSVPSDLLGAVGTSRNHTPVTTTNSSSPQSYTTHQTTSTYNVNVPTSILTSRFDSAVHPHYSHKTVRLKSFQQWPDGHSQQPEDLVDAGFFYAGYSDCVRCFVCGVGLRTWEEGDDPWVEHVRWRSSCAYVEAARGMTFIIKTLAAIGRSMKANPQSRQHQQQSSNDLKAQNSSEDDIMRTDPCQRALEMGFSPEQIRSVAQTTMRSRGPLALELDVLLDNILAIDGDGSELTPSAQGKGEVTIPQVQTQNERVEGAEGNMHCQVPLKDISRIPPLPLETRHADEKQDSGYMSSEVNPDAVAPHSIVTSSETADRVNMGDNNHQCEVLSGNIAAKESTLLDNERRKNGRDHDSNVSVNGFLSLPVPSQRIKAERKGHDKTKNQLKATKEETQQLRESSACKICLEDPANIVFLPCGHMVACGVCSPALERCPVCRKHIRGTVRVHLVDMASREKHISNI